MLILQAFFLWLMLSGCIIGGAVAFRSLFPQESPWLGFLVPSLAVVLLLNFIEHMLALPSLLALAPILLGFTLWSLWSRRFYKEGLLLPSLVFLASFAFTFGVRCIQPDILYTSDGLADLTKINNYCHGDVLPPVDTWLPPYRYEWYYSLQHYAASIVKRLFDLKIGVAYNVSHALLSALTCMAAAGAAYRISGGRIWITWAVPFLIESATTGSSAYIQLTMRGGGHEPSLWLADNLAGAFDDLANNSPDNPLWTLLAAPHHERLELQVPGFWTWRDEYHANASGHLLTLFSILTMAELSRLRNTVLPWVLAPLIPLVAVVASSWALPITVLLCGSAAVYAWCVGRRPADLRRTAMLLGGAVLLLWPAFYDVTSSPEVPSIMWTKHEEAAPFWEFVVQWWPVGVLWLYGCFIFRELSFPLRCVLVIVPLMLFGIEWITIEGRYNMVEKMWGYTYGAGLFALFPLVATRPGVVGRGITIVLLVCAAISMSGWLRALEHSLPWGSWPAANFHLQGDAYLRSDSQKKQILEVFSQMKNQTFLTGKSVNFNYYESPAPQVFTENRSFSTWTYFESVANYAEVAQAREKLNNDFYSGAMPNRLQFLESNNIRGVLIWPDNQISDADLATLTKDIDAGYQYIDCRNGGPNNAGVFLRRDTVTPVSPAAAPVPAPAPASPAAPPTPAPAPAKPGSP
jgi:hypothetical protein